MVEQLPINRPSPAVAGSEVPPITSERQIWQAAIILLREHGIEAVAIAEHRALGYRSESERLYFLVWSWIARAAEELIRAEPGLGEYRH